MQVGSSTNAPAAANTGSSTNVAQEDSAFAALLGDNSDDPATMLQKITSNGLTSLWSWQIDQMKKDAAAEVMQGMNLTPQQIAAMPPGQRAAIEDKIIKAVEQKVKQMVEQMEKNKNKNDPIGLSISSTPDASDIGATLNLTV